MALNVILALIMLGIALDLKVSDFKVAFKTPKALLLGLVGHHIVFPAMTFLLILATKPMPSIALGMLLVSLVRPVTSPICSRHEPMAMSHWPFPSAFFQK